MNKKAVIHFDGERSIINPNVYGHFAEHLGRCIYEGIWVGEESAISNTNGIRNDVLQALKNLEIPVLRWPGGCFADEYHWKDGIDQEKAESVWLTRIGVEWSRTIILAHTNFSYYVN